MNPTQVEAMLMVAIQIIASDVAVSMGGAEGNFEPNTFRPMLIYNYLHSALIMADMCDRFREFMVEGTRLNQPQLRENIDRSVMMVTALSPVIGYDGAAAISTPSTTISPSGRRPWQKGLTSSCTTGSWTPLALTRPGTADLPSSPKGS